MKNKSAKLTVVLILTSVMILSTAACTGTATSTIPATEPADATSATTTESKPVGTTTAATSDATTTAAADTTTQTQPAETTAAASSSTAESTTTAATTVAQKTFTLAELAQYNGQNGNPSYVAVNGIVYDVSALQQWKNGTHQGYLAGVDLTKDFQSAPHGTEVLLLAKEVGILVP